MATSINVRLSDELEENLKRTVEEVKKETPRGAEVNNSTIVRGALEEFIKKNEDNKNGVLSVSAPFGKLGKKELENVIKLSNEIIDQFNSEKLTDGQKMFISTLELLILEIKHVYITK